MKIIKAKRFRIAVGFSLIALLIVSFSVIHYTVSLERGGIVNSSSEPPSQSNEAQASTVIRDSDVVEKENKAISAVSSNTLVMQSTADWMYVFPEDIYRNADLVLVGKLVEEKESFVVNGGVPYTISLVEPVEMVKGDPEEAELEVVYMGGTVSVEEYVEGQFDDIRETVRESFQNGDLRSLTTVTLEGPVPIDVGAEYLFFLKNKKPLYQNGYLSASGEHGMLKIDDDGRVYIPSEEKYEELDVLLERLQGSQAGTGE